MTSFLAQNKWNPFDIKKKILFIYLSVCRTPCVVCTVSNCAREGQRTDETQLTLSHNLRPVHRLLEGHDNDDDGDNDDDDGGDDDGDLWPVHCLLEGHDNAGLVGIFLIINFSDKGVYTNGVPRTTDGMVRQISLSNCQIAWYFWYLFVYINREI